MTDNQSSYRQILKATSIFGGVQIFNIFIQLLKSKVVAILLGPAGIGIMGLLTSTIGMIASFTNFGVGSSGVKFISAAHAAGKPNQMAIAIKVLRRIVWITGALGSIIMFICANWLSELTFGNRDYTLAFSILSITLLVNQISIGQNVLLQSTRELKKLAKSSMIGSLVGLLSSLPLYYFLGVKGIVPSILITSFTTLLLSWYFARQIKIKGVFVSRLRTIRDGRGVLKTGLALSVSAIITMVGSYYLRIYISNNGGVREVGLYNAGFTIINTYVGLLFSAMITDYFPRLSMVANNDSESRTTINNQAEITILILSPIILIFLVYINWIIVLLYTDQFILVSGMIWYAALGMFFKAASWTIAFVLVAKSANKVYFWSELVTNCYLLIFSILGYQYYGITGLGIAFLITYFLYLIQVYVIARLLCNFSFTNRFIKIFSIQILLAGSCFLVVKFMDSPYQYIVGSALICISGYYSVFELNKLLSLWSLIRSKMNK